MAGSSLRDTMAGQFVIYVSSILGICAVAVAVAPHFRAAGAPYANWLAAVFGWLVVSLATFGLYRTYQ